MFEINKRKVLVTGADGFIGSHMIEKLVSEGCHVRAFVFYNSFNSWGWLDTLPKSTLSKIEIFTGDIRDSDRVRQAVLNVDVVIHLAALVGIPYSYQSPGSYIDTNIKGTLNILQASCDAEVKKILVTSTSEVYGTAQYVPIDENHPYQAQSPYSATKIGADRIAESFITSFNLPVTIVRPFNTYGPRQSARAIIPSVVIQLLNGQSTIKIGDTSPTRDMVFVKDTVDGYVAIVESDKLVGREVNIATGQENTIKQIAQTIISIINPRAKLVQDSERFRPEASEVNRLLGSREKITKLTGWKPNYSLKKGLLETIQWFKKADNLKRYKADIYNV